MNIPWRTIIWQQFGAAIDDLGNTIEACPDELWRIRLWEHPEHPAERPEFSQFWYIAYHALFWLDLYLTGAEEAYRCIDMSTCCITLDHCASLWL
jgi:hypothetical protein